MHAVFSIKSRTKFAVAVAVLSAAMLAFVGDATAEDTGNVVVIRCASVRGAANW
jgi:hypothetical protein